MKLIKLFTFALLVVTGLFSTSAIAGDFGFNGKWETGYGQGMSEFSGGYGKVSLYITCDVTDGTGVSMYARDTKNNNTIDFGIVVDGTTYRNFVKSDGSPNGRNWDATIRALRNAKRDIHLAFNNGAEMAIPIKNNKALPVIPQQCRSQ